MKVELLNEGIMNKNRTNKLLLSVSLLGMMAYSSNSNAQIYQCIDYQGNPTSTNAPCNGVTQPSITCNSGTPVQGGGHSEDDNLGGGYLDLDGDGYGDIAAEDYVGNPGAWPSSDNLGGATTGQTSINQYGWVDGTHENGYEYRTDVANSSGESDGDNNDNTTGWNGGGTQNWDITELWDGDGCVVNCGGVGNESGNSDSGNESGGDASDNGDDSCFVTTAVTQCLDEADNGPTLTALRHMRDYYTIHNWRGQDRIQIYYDVAPQIVETINQRADQKEIWHEINQDWIQPIVALIHDEDFEKADRLYADMVVALTLKYLINNIANENKQKLFLHAIKIV